MSLDELRTAMRALGYKTQTDLAAAIGVSRSAVSLWLEDRQAQPVWGTGKQSDASAAMPATWRAS